MQPMDQAYDCQYCSLKFLNGALLKNHRKNHGKPKKLKGFKIKKEPVTIKLEPGIVKTKRDPDVPIPRCNLCYRKFASNKNLRRHCEKVHGEGEEAGDEHCEGWVLLQEGPQRRHGEQRRLDLTLST